MATGIATGQYAEAPTTHDELTLFAATAWGKCPAFGYDLRQTISRQCPLGREVAEYLGHYTGIEFPCAYYHNDCPLEAHTIDALLALEAE